MMTDTAVAAQHLPEDAPKVRVAGIINPRTIKVEICRALGFDPSRIGALTIELDYKSMVRVSASFFADNTDIAALSAVVKRYHLIDNSTGLMGQIKDAAAWPVIQHDDGSRWVDYDWLMERLEA